ncbi:MAG TPA: DUF4097 family beta strand repeat-containing protein [Blastocatellia bacterium]|nr:DUF4097 family beta strand repeat-containing protein [Blastocatellia bacterium]
MRKSILGSVVAVCAILLVGAGPAAGQDFHRSYTVGQGGHVAIHNVSGDVIVTGYDGEQIIVDGFKSGADQDRILVEDNSAGDSVDLKAKYPRDCNCDASIKFDVKVPRSFRIDFGSLSTASGNVSVTDVTGNVNANSASGNVAVTNVSGDVAANSASGDVTVEGVAGSVRANTASGNVEARLATVAGGGDMHFNTASGNVRVFAPEGLDAAVNISTASGSLKTDFPLQMSEPQHGSFKSAHGTLGSGSHSLRISSASGTVSLLHSSSAG